LNVKPASVYLIGLTGNIACGKSTVLKMLAECGAHVIDADRVVHELQQPGQAVYDEIVAVFGSDILSAPNGPIDRRKLGAIVFTDPTALRRLEQIVHPAVHAHILAWLDRVGNREEGTGKRSDLDSRPPTPDPRPLVAVIDAIKLLEAGWKPLCDAIWVVTCTREQQLERLITTRVMSEREALERIDAQPPQGEKVAQADVIIDNSGSLEHTRRQVAVAWRSATAGVRDQGPGIRNK
jgi:dephospho-CoA kinase